MWAKFLIWSWEEMLNHEGRKSQIARITGINIIAGPNGRVSMGDCVHVAGVLNFLRLAESLGYNTEFLGPAKSPEK